MAVFTIASLWLCSIFLMAGLGWYAGIVSQKESSFAGPTGRVSMFGVVSQALSPARLLRPKGDELRTKGKPVPQGPSAAPKSDISKRAKPRVATQKRRSNVFDDMPPLEVVRSEANAIRQAERVWDWPDAKAQLLSHNMQTHATSSADDMGKASHDLNDHAKREDAPVKSRVSALSTWSMRPRRLLSDPVIRPSN